MLHLEYNWTACCYSFRIGSRFTDFRGVHSFETLREWKTLLAWHGLQVGRKCGTVWNIEPTAATLADWKARGLA